MQGSIIDLRRKQGLGMIRYRVVSASDRTATAEADGDNDACSIDIGNHATFSEDDSDAASAWRFRRKRLP